MLVPSGLPHTVQDGVFVLELQEPTDLSILLEWQGFAVDGFADGHLDLGFDTALDAVDYSAVSASDLDALVLPREDIERAGLHTAMPAEAEQYFRLHRLHSTGDAVDVAAGFAIALVTEGSGVLAAPAGSLEIAKGDALLIPYAVGPWSVHGVCTVMVCRPPAPDAPAGAR
jgi:mannose-6-phosphate isomerase